MSSKNIVNKLFEDFDDDEELDMDELVDRWCKQNRCYSFEMDSGVRNFEKLVKVLGYSSSWGDSLREFLGDNPGAMEAMMNFIRDSDVEEWKENLKDATYEEPEEDDEAQPVDDGPEEPGDGEAQPANGD